MTTSLPYHYDELPLSPPASDEPADYLRSDGFEPFIADHCNPYVGPHSDQPPPSFNDQQQYQGTTSMLPPFGDGLPFTLSSEGAPASPAASFSSAVSPTATLSSRECVTPLLSDPPDTPSSAAASPSPVLDSSTGRPSSTSSPSSSSSFAPRTVRKRQRVVCLSAEQRLERQRAQHRAVDANRRQRENDTIDRLQRLIAHTQQQSQGQPSSPTDEVDMDGGTAGRSGEDDAEEARRKVGRLTVLESSIALIQRLTAACQRMDAACRAKDAQLSRVSSHLHSVAACIAQQATAFGGGEPSLNELPAGRMSPHTGAPHSDVGWSSSNFVSVLSPVSSSYLSHSDRARSLHCPRLACFSSLCVLVLAPPGIVLHINERFSHSTGWSLSDLIHTSFEREAAATRPLSPLVRASHPVGSPGSVHRPHLMQYPSALRQVEAVVGGERRKAECTWRCRMRDGRVFESDGTFLGEYDVPPAKDERRSPDRMIYAYEMENAIIIDPVNDTHICRVSPSLHCAHTAAPCVPVPIY